MAKSVSYLGHQIDAEGLHPLPYKVAAVPEAPLPQDVAELKSYLGLLFYYNKFLPNLSTVVIPLNKLKHWSQPWQWTDKAVDFLVTSSALF